LLKKILGGIKKLYLPSPSQGVKDRAMRPFTPMDREGHAVFLGSVNARQIYQTPDLDTKGFTLHNCFALVDIITDTGDPAQEPLVITGELLGSLNSAPCVEAATGIAYTGPGQYAVPLLATEISMATQIRFRLQMTSGTPRTITYFVDGMLVAGPRI